MNVIFMEDEISFPVENPSGTVSDPQDKDTTFNMKSK